MRNIIVTLTILNIKIFVIVSLKKAPKGESYRDVYHRVHQFFEQMNMSDDETIVIVAHQVVIRCIFAYFNVIGEEEALDYNVENCKPYFLEV